MKTSVTNFLNNEVVDFASYSTMRALASYIDGQKNASRKVLSSIMNRPNKDTKVSILSGLIMTDTEYLHGDISGSIVTLAQNYLGTNNLPLLTREGNFGTRFENEASATRYIFTAKEKYFDNIFKKEDNDILIQQYFEGTKIEPRFFVPTLPLILVNGSEGIATGFAQKILSRDIANIKKAINLIIDNKEVPKDLLKPSFNGFLGSIEQGDSDNQWLIKGKINRISKIKFEISELPVGVDLKTYIGILDDLEENKIIRSYKDNSENDKFSFEISVSPSDLDKWSDEDILQKFKLVKKVSENYTCLNENNRVTVFNNAEEILRAYVNIKLEHLNKRKLFQIDKLGNEIKYDFSKFTFIKSIVENKLVINKRKKADIEKDLEIIENIIKKDNSYDYLLNMSMISLTEERMNKLTEEIKTKKAELDKLKETDIKDIWKDEIGKI